MLQEKEDLLELMVKIMVFDCDENSFASQNFTFH